MSDVTSIDTVTDEDAEIGIRADGTEVYDVDELNLNDDLEIDVDREQEDATALKGIIKDVALQQPLTAVQHALGRSAVMKV